MANTTSIGRIDTSKWPTEFQGYDVGGNGFIYVSFDSNTSTPHWFELASVTDVSLTENAEEIDATTRRSDRVKSSLPGQLTISFDTTIMVDMNDLVYKALQESFLTGFIPRFGVFTSNGNGPVFDGSITDLSRTENMNETVKAALKVSNAQFVKWYNTYDSSATTSGADGYGHPMGNFTDASTVSAIALGAAPTTAST